MRRFLILVFLAFPLASHAGTYTAASCSQADVNAIVNGPTHTAVDGDIIEIPAGTCTWTSGISAPGNIGISIIGAGAASLTITVNFTGASAFSFSPQYGNSLTRISAMTLVPSGTTPNRSPITIAGTCTASGCPNARVDHIALPSSWSACPIADSSFVAWDNAFGVLDHNTVGDVLGSANGVDFVNVNHSAWEGTGAYGDNSWATAGTMGSDQAVYLEDNTFNYAFGTDVDRTGGGRLVCRFNTFNSPWNVSACGGHGTETTGRMRGLRQMEAYGNTVTCTNASNGCDALWGFRSGTGVVFGNSHTASGGAWINKYTSLNTERTYRPTVWGLCAGIGPYDVNAGSGTAYSGTISTFSGSTLTVSGTPWVAHAYQFSSSSPGANYYVAYDLSTGQLGGISDNTASALTIGWNVLSVYGNTFTGNGFQNGDSFAILASTLSAAGTHTGSSGVQILTDSTKSWTVNQWAGYALLDITQGLSWQVGSNTSDTASYESQPNNPSWTLTSGDEYAILRSTQCFDQPALSGGSLLSGTVPAIPASAETVDPIYEWDNTGTTPLHGYVESDSLLIAADSGYYSGGANGAQTNATSPFDGTTGVGFGTLANRPTTCTQGVGYFATDQGTWNHSGNGFGQGVLYTCSATNTWTASYTPYTYPHPLTGNPTAATPTFDPTAGSYSSTQSVTISSTSMGAVICYTTDGSTPATDSTTGCTTGTLYSTPISVSTSETVKAIAGGAGYTDSGVGSAAYTIGGAGTLAGSVGVGITGGGIH